jgi:microcystin-dependent protein
MSQPFVGEIRLFGGNFAPAGWAFCDGSLVPIAENETLFNLIGTTYGGDGQNTFALPDLRGRVPIHQGSGFIIGQSAGEESVNLTVQQIPIHTHAAECRAAASNSASPTGNFWGASSAQQYTLGTSPLTPMAGSAILPTGGSQPHDNMIPFLGINFIISLFGVFPSQT